MSRKLRCTGDPNSTWRLFGGISTGFHRSLALPGYPSQRPSLHAKCVSPLPCSVSPMWTLAHLHCRYLSLGCQMCCTFAWSVGTFPRSCSHLQTLFFVSSLSDRVALKGPQPPVYTLQCLSVPFKINPKSEHKSQSPLPVPYSANISLPLRPQLICHFLWGSLSAHNSEFSHSQTSSRGPCYFLGTDGSILHRGCIIICLGSLALWGQGPCLH